MCSNVIRTRCGRFELQAYKLNQDAAQRALDFSLGWFAEPLYFGDYPKIMRVRVGAQLPVFSDEERALVKGSADFFGLNHYSTW